MAKKLLTSIAGAALLVATAFTAQASTTTFDFTDSDPFTSDNGDTLNAYGYLYSFEDSFFGTAESLTAQDVVVTSDGLGVSTLGGDSEITALAVSSGFFNFSTGVAEILVLEMPSNNWSPESVSFSNFNTFVDDYVIFGSNGFDLSTTTGFAAAVSSFDQLADSTSEAPPVSNPFNDFSDDVYEHIIIAAAFLDPDLIPSVVANSFNVAGFSGTVVPLPAALPLLATALAGFGLVSLRRRRALAA